MKTVEYDGRVASQLEIDTTKLDDATVELAWHFGITNQSNCARIRSLRLVDNLPGGFTVREVVAAKDGPGAGSVFFGLVPFVLPGVIVLASTNYAFTGFDDSRWNVVHEGGTSILLFEATTSESTFNPGRHIHLIVRGSQAVPPRKSKP